MSSLPPWLISYLRQPFVFIVWVMETYAKNTARLKVFMTKPRVMLTFKLAITVTMLVWIVVGVIASDADRGRLTKTLTGFWDDIQGTVEQKNNLNN